MPEQNVTFTSKGLNLSGAVKVPDGVKAGERRPAFIVLHGFGSRMIAENVTRPCAMLDKLGYVTMRFDMPGCGESEGEKGLLLCLDQVQATSDALTLLAQNPNVDPKRIAILGSSFGAAVVVYCGGIDERVAAVVSASGWGHGERKFRGQHPTPEGWKKFTAMLEEGRGYRERTGKPLMVPRYDIVPIPEHLRTHVVPGSVQIVPLGDRAEHVRLPRQRRGGQDRAAAAAADAQFRRSRHAGRAIDRTVRDTPASRPNCTCSPTPITSCSPKAIPACIT